jgi:dTDP-4-amino-4,6-dideoxygalactose transaminase
MKLSYSIISDFEQKLARFTGAPYAVAVDCCTHAIELCVRLLKIKECILPPDTYISVPQTLRMLGIKYRFEFFTPWLGEYNLRDTPVWDSARMLRPDMYRPGQYQCLSFGPGKPLDNTRGGAILLDNKEHYQTLKIMSNDGRDLSISPWQDQKSFPQGFHYMMRIEEAQSASVKLDQYIDRGKFVPEYIKYPDLRTIKIYDQD